MFVRRDSHCVNIHRQSNRGGSSINKRFMFLFRSFIPLNLRLNTLDRRVQEFIVVSFDLRNYSLV